MSRPLKSGVEYFPMDTGFFSDKKVKLLKGEFGACGLLIVLSTLCRIYSTNGYYVSFDADDAILTADELGCGITPNLVREVVQGSVKRSLFDEGVFNQFGVLTSPGIQRRYIRAVSTRDEIQFFEEYWLLDVNDRNDVPRAVLNKLTFSSVSLKKTPVFFEKTPINSGENPQRKVKESTVKESTTGGGRPDSETVEAYASRYLVNINPRQIEKLYTFLEDLPDELIRHAIDVSCLNGKPYFNYAAQIMQRYADQRYKKLADALDEEQRRKTSAPPSQKPKRKVKELL